MHQGTINGDDLSKLPENHTSALTFKIQLSNSHSRCPRVSVTRQGIPSRINNLNIFNKSPAARLVIDADDINSYYTYILVLLECGLKNWGFNGLTKGQCWLRF